MVLTTKMMMMTTKEAGLRFFFYVQSRNFQWGCFELVEQEEGDHRLLMMTIVSAVTRTSYLVSFILSPPNNIFKNYLKSKISIHRIYFSSF